MADMGIFKMTGEVDDLVRIDVLEQIGMFPPPTRNYLVKNHD
jgi:hypothetical protein